MFKNALVSVSNKEGLIEFLGPLHAKGMRITSTGGTAEHLRAAGLQVQDVKDVTGFPEVMGGRVKTLHPRMHMSLLARPGVQEDSELLQKEGLEPFDLVVVNLYPFEQTLLSQKTKELSAELIEKIDIGGPAMIRASAKNFERVSIVVDPRDYSWIASQAQLERADRLRLAAKAFAHVSRYDSLVSHVLGGFGGVEMTLGGQRVQGLRYGENPGQEASWYSWSGERSGLQEARVLQGKELSYNNILDLEAATALVREFESPTCVAVKHNNPCGVGSAADILVAVERALMSDPVSVFGGIVAVNSALTKECAEQLSRIFLECIVAPSVLPEALEVLKSKKNLRVLEWPGLKWARSQFEVRSISGGFLLQTSQALSSDTQKWKFLGEVPDAGLMRDLQFAEKVVASLKSNAIAIVKNQTTLGLGMGQVNRVDAVSQAVQRMKDHHGSISITVLASDAFFPFPDSIEKASQAGVKWILQPGGSLKDQEVFQMAKKLGVNMVLTGERHFRH